MSGRSGYCVVAYCVDVSPSMGDPVADPDGSGVKRSKLTWVKEYVARVLEPKIQSGRKTECIGLVSFGGKTNNSANADYRSKNPNDEDAPYSNVSVDVAIQTAKPVALESLMNLEVGEAEGNPISAILCALDAIQMHKHTKSWTLEVVLITDGESAFDQEEYEEAMELLDKLGVKLTVIGVGFDEPSDTIDKSKPKPKRLSEKFWRVFVRNLEEQIARSSSEEQFIPVLKTFEPELTRVRMPQPDIVNGTLGSNFLYIGSEALDAKQSICIPFKYTKATAKARPPTLSKAWKTAVDMQQPTGSLPAHSEASQLMTTLQSQSQSQGQNSADLLAAVSADVKQHNTYYLKKVAELLTEEGSGVPATIEEEEEEREYIPKEELVKAWRFGSSWIPVEDDTFEPLNTQKGLEILGFIPQKNVQRYMLIGEVRYLWPDLKSPRAQIEFSSFVSALVTTGMAAITRWVGKDGGTPEIGVCIPKQSFGENSRLDLMFWIRLPFADDDHKFFFQSLTNYKSVSGNEITEHPYIPTQEQSDLMDEFVKGMNLDTVPPPGQEEEDGIEEEAGEDEGTDRSWYDPAFSYNPSIHRTKQAVLHAALTADPKSDPLGPPHPELTKYFYPPERLVENTEKVTERLKEALNIKKVTRAQRKKRQSDGAALGEGEGLVDIDELFDNSAPAKPDQVSPTKPKVAAKDDKKPDFADDPDFIMPPPAKPKQGRIISNQKPLEDFKRVTSTGDVFKKAIQDIGAVVAENVAASFSRQAFPTAIACLTEARSTALMYEESETYNAIVKDLEKTVKDPGFKHKDFWKAFEAAGQKVAVISPEEAAEALEEDYE